jgi:hypothetical protein
LKQVIADVDNLDEHQLIAVMTSHLGNIYNHSSLVLVNSEESKWIHTTGEHPANYQKVDMLVIAKGLQITGKETGSALIKHEGIDKSMLLFGVIPWEIRDMLHCIIEWKVVMTPANYGELYSYLQHLSRGDEHNTYYGMLCDRAEFVMVQCKNQVFGDVLQGNWTYLCICDFSNRKNDWLVLLDNICGQLNLELHINCKLKTAFLGAGAMGRVFEVKDKDTNEIYALKLVLGRNEQVPIDQILTLARAEFDAMKGMAEFDCVMNVVDGSFKSCTEIVRGVGYLMTTIGEKVSVKSKKTRDAIFMSLLELHLLGRTHGDARLANVLRISIGNKKFKYVWIDCMLKPVQTDRECREHDVITLANSLLGEGSFDKTSQQIADYAKQPTKTNMSNLLSSL